MREYEDNLKDKFKYICGVDEAGRGPLCAEVVAAAVVVNDIEILGINDSKKLSPKKREELYEKIINSYDYGIGIASIEEIEKYNILGATKIAMIRAINNLKNVDYVLIDGNQNLDIDIPSKTIVSGDSKSISIAAASIIAKVTRDRMMVEYDKIYPEYNFKKHKGYGTAEH
ncbi:MAG: ribonuclease HII, partial [Clostridia bacterium]